jgi:glucose/arabinose dehydrogenase
MPNPALVICFVLLFSAFNLNSQPVASFNPVISSGLTNPVDIVSANDGTNRIFIAEQGGTIKAYDNNFNLLNNNFLTITGNFTTGGERGLLSLAFHPDFENNRYFFVYYTNAAGGINIDRFQVLTTDPNQADAATQTNIMTVVKPVAFGNHNGGKLNFGADGNLYFALGDGGGTGDPRNFAQRGDSLWGKMVRINVDNFTTAPFYTIPADNPFVADPNVLDEIFSLGLRNPWRWSFDKLNGNFWIADVGQGAREEVSVLAPAQASGANYGWRCYEGFIPYIATGCLPASNYEPPIFDYPHNNATGGFSITGGYVYRGSLYPAMYGYYICADYVSGNVWVINATTFATSIQTGVLSNVAAFGELENGELVALSRNGVLYRVFTNTALSLKLTDFNGYAAGNYKQLNWQTADEKEVLQFEVEYSSDGVLFKKAGTITAKNENIAVYTFRHYVQNNVVFYRLKMLHQNGDIEYSKVIAVKNKRTEYQPVIYFYNGNPRAIWLNTSPNEKATFQLFNLNGQAVMQKENYLNNAIIDLQKIPAGLYIGKIITADKTVSEKILIK